MSGITHNAFEVAARLERVSGNARTVLAGEMDGLAQRVANRMKMNAPKFQSTLLKTIKPDRTGEFEWRVGPHVAYASAIEDGVKPGGKGLPKWADAPQSMLEWLQANPPSGVMSGPRTGSELRDKALGLRNRYMGKARRIRQFGIAPNPFVSLTAEQMRPLVLARMRAAVAAALDGKGAVA